MGLAAFNRARREKARREAEAEAAAEEREVQEAEESEDGQAELEALTVDELRGVAAAESVDLTGTRRKDDIIAAIVAAREEVADGTD